MKLVDWQCDVCGVKAKIPEGSDPPIHNCKPRGLGDLVAKGLKKVGITKERTTRVKQILTGNDYAECGCKGRQDWLNSLWTFNEKEDDNTDIEMPYYWLEDEARLSRDAICQNIRMWSHPSEDTEAKTRRERRNTTMTLLESRRGVIPRQKYMNTTAR